MAALRASAPESLVSFDGGFEIAHATLLVCSRGVVLRHEQAGSAGSLFYVGQAANGCGVRYDRVLCEEISNHVTMDIREPEVATLVTVG